MKKSLEIEGGVGVAVEPPENAAVCACVCDGTACCFASEKQVPINSISSWWVGMEVTAFAGPRMLVLTLQAVCPQHVPGTFLRYLARRHAFNIC